MKDDPTLKYILSVQRTHKTLLRILGTLPVDWHDEKIHGFTAHETYAVIYSICRDCLAGKWENEYESKKS